MRTREIRNRMKGGTPPSSMHSLGNDLEGHLWGHRAVHHCRTGEQLVVPAWVCTSSALRQAVKRRGDALGRRSSSEV